MSTVHDRGKKDQRGLNYNLIIIWVVLNVVLIF